jgi:phage terminase large subunit-like protein
MEATAAVELDNLPPAQLEKLLARLEAEKQKRVAENRLAHYRPYPKQAQFHEAGATHRERLFLAANQSGKTLAGGMEVAMHVTGRYAAWWKGKRFDGPTVGWCAGITSEGCRDTIERILLGRSSARGTGAIPKADIVELIPSRGVPEACDIVRVKHVSGGISTIGFKAYADGRAKFQGETLDWCWCDEEPPADIYTEILTRTNVGSGPVLTTATPLLGMSEVIRRFLLEKSPDRHVTTMTLDEALHFSEEERARIFASYPKHELEARTKGIPVLGSGRIFPVTEEILAIEQREIPPHWPRIGGLDFGWTHPSAAVELAWDRDTDVVYVVKAFRLAEATPVVQCGTLRAWGNIPWAWPRDGRRETLEGAGKPLADQYSAQGLNMLYQHAQFEDGSVSVEAGLMEMLTRMEGGRFKVFKHLHDWWEEFRLYHRKDGKVVKERDDLMSATRYAIMSLRHAETADAYASFNRRIEYPTARAMGIV